MRALKLPYLISAYSRVLLFVCLATWAISETALNLRHHAEAPLFVAFTEEGDPILISERSPDELVTERFRMNKRLLDLLYNYDSATYQKRSQKAAGLLSEVCIKKKAPEFISTEKKLASIPYKQSAQIVDISDESADPFWAVLKIQLTKNPKTVNEESMTQFWKVTIKDAARQRTRQNWYSFEVAAYDEQKIDFK